jgi:hypothetical protein
MVYGVRWFGAVAGVGLLTLVVDACAVISGLEDYSGADCHVGCDATPDRPAPSPVPVDVLSETDGDESTLDVDAATADGPAGDDAGDSESVSASDGGARAMSEGGCGPLDNIDNCSACGLACSTSSGTPSCDGTKCSYACASNRRDCNGGVAPDEDGCECTGVACCGAGCQTIHNGGISSPAGYYDCNPKGNAMLANAMAACTGTGGSSCSSKNTSCGGILGFGGTPTNAACGTVAGTCYCWVYSGQNAGQVQSGDRNCGIACASGSAWN